MSKSIMELTADLGALLARHDELAGKPKVSRETRLHRALSDLLEQIDSLEDVTFTRDLEYGEAESNWNDVVRRAQESLR